MNEVNAIHTSNGIHPDNIERVTAKPGDVLEWKLTAGSDMLNYKDLCGIAVMSMETNYTNTKYIFKEIEIFEDECYGIAKILITE